MTATAKLRALLAKEEEIIVCPGVYDGSTARLTLNAKFQNSDMVFCNQFNDALGRAYGIKNYWKREYENECSGCEKSL
ncbi:hypothetical protein OCU04_005720 [Sclerotinia nivalis]|uniref:Uncharacterized protein n=1 Tax=Sclerotinia nivalis TaxID=352851 RepID=A0A9X0DM32_9HELO|nr:hypothetical protein OCU04_005720 [Sclerotinia nivalis]